MSLLPVHIPSGFILSIKNGDTLIAGQIIAKRSEKLSEIRIPLASLLNISPKKAEKYLKKLPGDVVRVGEIIARKSSFITSEEVVSSVGGTVLSFDLVSGDMIVEKSGEDEVSEASEIVSPFDGIVTDCLENRVMLTTKDRGIIGLKGTGGSAQGQLIFVEGKGQGIVAGEQITVDMIGNVVLGKLFTKEALVKASGMGVAGIITLKINDEDVAILEQKRMLLPIIEVNAETWQVLAKQIGKKVYLDSVIKTIFVS